MTKSMSGVAAAVLGMLIIAPAFGQPSPKEQEMIANIDCSSFKHNSEGIWTGKDGKTFVKSDPMAVALDQKCGASK